MELQNSLDLNTLFDLPTPENYQLSWFPWNGSKRWILDDLAFLMNKWDPKGARYFEPFVGGGCVSYLMRTLFPSVSQVIGDANPWLMAAYQNQLQNSKFNLKEDSITPEWIEKQRSYEDRDLPSLNVYDKSLRFATCLLTAWGNRWEASESGEFKSTLSDFCVNLTTITPNLLEEEGVSYYDACAEICSHYNSKNRMWASWGDWDRQMFSRNPTNEESTLIPVSIQPVDHLNIKTLCAMKRGLKRAKGLGRSCRAMGIEFEGTAHRGVDDAYNMSKVLLKILG